MTKKVKLWEMEAGEAFAFISESGELLAGRAGVRQVTHRNVVVIGSGEVLVLESDTMVLPISDTLADAQAAYQRKSE